MYLDTFIYIPDKFLLLSDRRKTGITKTVLSGMINGFFIPGVRLFALTFPLRDCPANLNEIFYRAKINQQL